MKKCIHYLLGRCEFVIMLKFALIIPLSCKAMMYICVMENCHANINFMLYLCYLFVMCVIFVFSIWRLASVLDPSLWPLAFWFQPLAPAAGLWPLTSSPLSQLLGARDQARMSLHRRLFEHKVKASIESCLRHIQTFITFSSITE